MKDEIDFSNVLTVIPARLESVRLPQKPMAMIHDKPMIYWVASRVSRLCPTDYVVATDSLVVAEICERFGFPFLMTSTSCKNGTERVFEVSQKVSGYSYFLNVQGDEPLFNPSVLTRMLESTGFKDDAFKVSVSKSEHRVNDPSEAKVAVQSDGRIRYVSRSSIPFYREGKSKLYKIQGVFLYTPQVLERFVNAPIGFLEMTEKLEQLRCIENDIELFAIFCEGSPRSVDTPADLNYFRSLPLEDFGGSTAGN